MTGPAPLSIVHLVENLDAGGLERFTIDLVQAQRAAGHDSGIACLHDAGALAPQAEAFGIPVTPLGKPPGFHVSTIWKLARVLRRGGVQVLNAHNPGVHHYGAAAAKLAGVPVVVNTRHGISSSSGRPFQERYFRAVLPWTSHVIYVSHQSEETFVEAKIVPREKGCVIWNGIPLGPFLARPASPGSLQPRIRFGTAGRLVPVKAHSNLLKAFARTHEQLPGTELYIYGSGPLAQELQNEIDSLGLTGCAFLKGSTQNMPAALSELDVFVFSSLSEGLPIVILEALAAGLPIASTRVGGVPEVAPEGEVAWYCPPGDVEALSKMLTMAATSGDLQARAERARHLAITRFSIEKVQADYEALYRRLLASGRAQ